MKETEKKSKQSKPKTSLKPSEKAVAKPVVKTKTAPSPGASATMPKVVTKAVVKPVAKKLAASPTTEAAPAKAAAKVTAKKTAKVAVKSAVGNDSATAKAAPSKRAVTTEKSGGKVIQKPSQSMLQTPKKAIKPASAVKPSAVVKVAKSGTVPATTKKTAPLTVAPAPLSLRTTEKSMLIPVPPALKPGRRSSARTHSQMPPPAPMVPTHAPDAAKASYSTITERVIAPPPHVAAKKDPKLANNWKTTAADALTDDEVKAMPDSEYMNEKQLAFFRHKLSILKQEIHNSAGETTEHLREDTVVVPDPADRATIEEEHALELRTRDRERKLLKKIEQSIARIDSGDYGYCDETGEPIGVGRLIARPTANLSLEAQQRRELKQKMFGD